MTVYEKAKKIEEFCHTLDSCRDCPLYEHVIEGTCFIINDERDLEFICDNYEIIFGDASKVIGKNPYWERITKMADRQREKGISTYGKGLEQNIKPSAMERVGYIQEELIDALMYLEWLKDKLKGE